MIGHTLATLLTSIAAEPPPLEGPAESAPDASALAPQTDTQPPAGAEASVEAPSPPSLDDVKRAALEDLEPGERMSLAQCLQAARRSSPDLAIASEAINAAGAERKSARGRFGPALVLDSSVQVWAQEVTVDFSPPGLMLDVDPVVVQDQVTSRTSVSLVQPLAGLWAIRNAHRAATIGAKAATVSRKATEQDLDLAVALAYYDALKTEQLVAVSALRIATIESLLERVEAFEAAGVVGRDQVLETEVSLAQGRSALIDAKAAMTLARANLAFHMGMPVDADIGPSLIEPHAAAGSGAQDRATPSSPRPDLEALRLRAEQARFARKLAVSSLLPQLNAVASYQRTDGQSFARNDQFFVGLTLNWTAWDWGATAYQIPRARAQERQARLAVDKAERGVALEVIAARTQLRSARQRYAQAKVAVTAAEENLRLVRARFDAAAATSTQVLDAVTRKAVAESTQATTYYDILKASAAHRKAMGRPVDTKAGQS